MFKKNTEILDNHQIKDGKKIKKIISFKKLLLCILILCAIVGIGFGAYYYREYQSLKANPNLEAEKEVKSLTSIIGKFMELPADETPTIATVLDKEKLKDQPFFSKAENGDKLLAYTKAMKAILYRPSTNKVIEVAPIYINQQEMEKTQSSTNNTPNGIKIAYYNGTEIAGLSSQAEKSIKAAYPNYQTGTLTNAAKNDYKETIVIDLTGTHGKETEQIANLLGGKVSSLPEGEAKPDADILVISGK
ncbi:MAG: LytR C-terminal domain-containing protein [Candidatus Paceibacterota bacterium]